MLFPLVESSLSEEILRTWQSAVVTMDVSANITVKNCLMHLMAFLEKKVESEERIHMAKTCFEATDNSTKIKDKKKSKSNREQDIVSSRIVNNEGNEYIEMFVLENIMTVYIAKRLGTCLWNSKSL